MRADAVARSSAAARAAFAAQGCLLLESALTPDEVAWARAATDRLRPLHWDYTGLVDHYKCVFNREPGWLSYLDRPGVIELAEALLGADCHVIGQTAWRCHPGFIGGDLHIDYLPSPIDETLLLSGAVAVPPQIISVHFFLDDIDAALAPTQVIVGSHRAGRAPIPGETSWRGRPLTPVLCRAGDALLFRSDLWHAGSRNRSDRVATCCRCITGAAWSRRSSRPISAGSSTLPCLPPPRRGSADCWATMRQPSTTEPSAEDTVRERLAARPLQCGDHPTNRSRLMATGAVRIGISGWRYAPWRGVFYPKELTQARELEWAARQLPSIEINGTFYSLQRPAVFQQWREAVPAEFVFSVKGGRFITHIRRLREIETPLANFLGCGLLALGPQLGPLLWQFPPSFRFEPESFGHFLALLPTSIAAAAAFARRHHDDRIEGRAWLEPDYDAPLRHAVEIRHDSFVTPAFVALLRKHNVALVVADAAAKWPLCEDVTADFLYLRLHGAEELYASGYTDAALDRWATAIDAWRHGREPDDARRIGGRAPRRSSRDVYCYFDNDRKVKAPGDARRLMQRLGLEWHPD